MVATASDEYEFETPRPLWAEQNPAYWWRACVNVVSAVLQRVKPEEIAGVGLTGQMHGLVLLDADGKVLRPCIMWNDQRTGKQCAEITELAGGAKNVLQLIGNPVLPGFTAPKFYGCAKTNPKCMRVPHMCCSPKIICATG